MEQPAHEDLDDFVDQQQSDGDALEKDPFAATRARPEDQFGKGFGEAHRADPKKASKAEGAARAVKAVKAAKKTVKKVVTKAVAKKPAKKAVKTSRKAR